MTTSLSIAVKVYKIARKYLHLQKVNGESWEKFGTTVEDIANGSVIYNGVDYIFSKK